MKINFQTLFLAIATLGFMGCSNDAEVEVPQEKEQLAITCFISPSRDQINCFVAHSLPIYGTNTFELPFVGDAEVVLSNGEISTTLIYDGGSGYYYTNQTEMPLEAGRTYTLRVTSPEFGTATATTTIPAVSALPTDATSTVEHRATSFGTDFIYYSKLEWNDPNPNEFNYYRITSELEGLKFGTPYQVQMSIDLDNDGSKTEGKLVSRTQYFDSDTISDARVNFSLLTCNKDYYEFHRTAFSQGDNGPFSEPVIMYDNVTNGFGCFGAYLEESTSVAVTE